MALTERILLLPLKISNRSSVLPPPEGGSTASETASSDCRDDDLSVSWDDGHMTLIPLSDRAAVLCWHQFLHAIGSPATLNDPQAFEDAGRAVGEIARLFLSVEKVDFFSLHPVLFLSYCGGTTG